MEKSRDILDLSSSVPDENQPKTDVDRPMVSPEDRKNFLNDFLDGETEKTSAEPTINGTEQKSQEASSNPEKVDAIVDALREIYDPEIPVNIYDMGLIYDVIVDENSLATVTMTLTTPHCPVAETMPGEVELRVNAVPGIMGAEVKLVWDPPWDMSRMSDEARLELGLL